MVPPSQRNVGYSIQSLLINIGAVIGSILPFVLTNVVGLENTAQMGQVAPSVMWAFYIGATVLLGTVIWTVIRTKEYYERIENKASYEAIGLLLIEEIIESESFTKYFKTYPEFKL